MWFETIVLGASRAELAIDPVRWFGYDGASWLTLLLVLVSFGIGYFYILKLKPGVVSEETEEEVETEEDEEVEEESDAEYSETAEDELAEDVVKETEDLTDEEAYGDETEEDDEADE